MNGFTQKIILAVFLVGLSSTSSAFAEPGKIAGTWMGGAASVSAEHHPLISGVDPEGKDIFLCRALYQAALHPGRIWNSAKKGCLISGNTEVVELSGYEVLQDENTFHWVSAGGSWMPADGVKTGFAVGGDAYYSCRVFHEKGLFVGKVVRERIADRDTYTCQIVYEGAVQKIPAYEILVQE